MPVSGGGAGLGCVSRVREELLLCLAAWSFFDGNPLAWKRAAGAVPWGAAGSVASRCGAGAGGCWSCHAAAVRPGYGPG